MVSEKAVEVALDVVLGEGVVDCSTDTMRRAMRAALEAALPMVVGEAVGYVRISNGQLVGELAGGKVVSGQVLYTLATPESAP